MAGARQQRQRAHTELLRALAVDGLELGIARANIRKPDRRDLLLAVDMPLGVHAALMALEEMGMQDRAIHWSENFDPQR